MKGTSCLAMPSTYCMYPVACSRIVNLMLNSCPAGARGLVSQTAASDLPVLPICGKSATATSVCYTPDPKSRHVCGLRTRSILHWAAITTNATGVPLKTRIVAE